MGSDLGDVQQSQRGTVGPGAGQPGPGLRHRPRVPWPPGRCCRSPLRAPPAWARSAVRWPGPLPAASLWPRGPRVDPHVGTPSRSAPRGAQRHRPGHRRPLRRRTIRWAPRVVEPVGLARCPSFPAPAVCV